MRAIRFFFALAVSSFAGRQAIAQLIVNNNQTVEYYVQNVLLGQGVTAFNITYNGMPANQINPQVGSFSCANCNVALPSGFVMATGDCQVAVGPNNSGSATLGGGVGFDGPDPDLNAISTGFGINDWAIIEFDFIPTGDQVEFQYVWGSEEYMEYVNSNFNDLFGFFLSGPGISGPYSNGAINIATIPGSGLPVTINNLNAGLNGQYYVNNGDGFTPPFSTNPYYIQFDGFTVPLTAGATVQCGETYHIKLACADSGDSILDSGVFFEAGSFASNPAISANIPNAPNFLPAMSTLEGCVEGIFEVYPPTTLTQDTTVVITLAGAAVNGVDYELISTTVPLTPGQPTPITLNPLFDGEAEGVEDVILTYVFVNNCGEPDTVTATLFIVDYAMPQITLSDLFICPGAPAVANPAEQGGAGTYAYQWSSGQSSPTVTYTAEDAGEYSVILSDYCQNSDTATFTVIEPLPFFAVESAEICLGRTSDPLVSGGALPYTYVYDDTFLELADDPGIFNGIAVGNPVVTVTDACNRSEEIPVLVKQCETLIPNVFTPNNDGKDQNEVFFIKGIEAFPGSELIVFNRWGATVYESSDYGNTWKAEDQPDGVYYYIFKRSDGKNFEGYVHVMR
jgi:gliding motility-associated-like protein